MLSLFLKWFGITLVIGILIVLLNVILLSDMASAGLPIMLMTMPADTPAMMYAGVGIAFVVIFIGWVSDLFTKPHKAPFVGGVVWFIIMIVFGVVVSIGVLLAFGAMNAYFACIFNILVLYPALIAASRIAFRKVPSWARLYESPLKIKGIDFRFTGEVIVANMTLREDILRFYQGVAISSGALGFLLLGAVGAMNFIKSDVWGPPAFNKYRELNLVEEKFNAGSQSAMFTLYSSPMITGYGLVLYSFLAIIRIKFQRGQAETQGMRDILTVHVDGAAESEEKEDPEIAEAAKRTMELVERVALYSFGFHYSVCVIFGAALTIWTIGKVSGGRGATSSLNFVCLVAILLGFAALFSNWSKVHANYNAKIKGLIELRPVILSFTNSPELFGLGCLFVYPFLPFYMLFGLLNQCCRGCRKSDDERGVKGTRGGMTSAITFQRDHFRKLNLVQVYRCSLWWGIIFFFATIGLNYPVSAAYAYISSIPKSLSFSIILWFAASVLLMQIPFVGAPLVYVACGYSISIFADTLVQIPVVDFIIANIMGIFLCIIVKAISLLMHVLLWGKSLKNSSKAKSIYRVNYPIMRTVELILRLPGFTPGKYALMCALPDWPIGVYGGMQQIGLQNLAMGSAPLVILQTICVCAGTLYTRKAENEFITPLAHAMFLLAGLFQFGFAFAAASEVQDKYNDFNRELNLPRLGDIELDWNTFKSDGKRNAFNEICHWTKIGFFSKFMLILSVFGQSLAIYVFLFIPNMGFYPIEVSDSQETFGETLQLIGLASLGAWAGCTLLGGLTIVILQKSCSGRFLQLESEAQLMRSQWEKEREENRLTEQKSIGEDAANTENRFLTVIEVIEERLEKDIPEEAKVRMRYTMANMNILKDEYSRIQKALQDPALQLRMI